MNKILCETCGTPLLKSELPENRKPFKVLWLPIAEDRQCFTCYAKVADLDGQSDDPELQKEHEEFIKKEEEYRRKKQN
tara:strand:+ start:18 stop:251 length:234 start_codon:yes stop_codon:yes gene_type:complete